MRTFNKLGWLLGISSGIGIGGVLWLANKIASKTLTCLYEPSRLEGALLAYEGGSQQNKFGNSTAQESPQTVSSEPIITTEPFTSIVKLCISSIVFIVSFDFTIIFSLLKRVCRNTSFQSWFDKNNNNGYIDK